MSKEHYITPEEFKILEYNDKIYTFRYGLGNNLNISYADNVITALRLINKKDPVFVYSCECNREETVWMFGYTSETIKDEAEAKCIEMIMRNRESRGESETRIKTSAESNYSACNCPLDI